MKTYLRKQYVVWSCLALAFWICIQYLFTLESDIGQQHYLTRKMIAISKLLKRLK